MKKYWYFVITYLCIAYCAICIPLTNIINKIVYNTLYKGKVSLYMSTETTNIMKVLNLIVLITAIVSKLKLKKEASNTNLMIKIIDMLIFIISILLISVFPTIYNFA